MSRGSGRGCSVAAEVRGYLRRQSRRGTNSTYCHPRKETVDALTAALGGAGAGVIHAFPSPVGCSASTAGAQWVDEPASDKLWVTARDGDVVLVTTGDGAFVRE